MSEDAIATWQTLPESVRNDECFLSIRDDFERNKGNLSKIQDCLDVIKCFAKFI